MSKKLNTIYIISKGRPQCKTAETLTKMKYTGDWFIVCGNNDKTIPKYQENWGKDRILIFDWFEQVKTSDLVDNFGVENMGSGAVPVRNATQAISVDRGETRHWQFDDDYTNFYYRNNQTGKWYRLKGMEFEAELLRLAEYADKAGLANIGISTPNDTRPNTIKTAGHRVFNAHNLPSDKGLFTIWRSRMNDDLINAIETYRSGKYELYVRYMMLTMPPTQSEKGGNTEIYLADGTVRKAAYAVIIDPKNVKLTIRHGRYHHAANWRGIIPKIVNSKYAKA